MGKAGEGELRRDGGRRLTGGPKVGRTINIDVTWPFSFFITISSDVGDFDFDIICGHKLRKRR